MRKIAYIVLFLTGFLFSNFANAEGIISAPQALQRAQAGEIIILDIRSRAEWKETGIATIASPVSMHENDFLDKFQKIKNDNPNKEIAIICATGGRTQWLQAELKKRNLGTVIDISEGMIGNSRGAGWIKRKLPIKAFN